MAAPLITTSTAEFAASLRHGRLAGLDVGTKTIGLAVCDAGWSFAGPSETIRRTKFTADLEALRKFVEQEQVTGLVLGLPLNMLFPSPNPDNSTWGVTFKALKSG